MTATPADTSANAGGKAATIAELRRRMARIPARADECAPQYLSSAAYPGDITDDEHTRRDDSGRDHTPPSIHVDNFGSPSRGGDDPARQSSPARKTPPTGSDVLPAPEPIAALLPHRGLRRGTVTTHTGSLSILTALVAATTAAGKHAAIIGAPRMGLLAAYEHGADLSKCASIADPGPDPVDIAAVLLDGIDLVVLDLNGSTVAPTRARAVTARARTKQACLLVTGGHWPAAELHLNADVTGYTGIGPGHGRITGIHLDLTATARTGRPRTGHLQITGTRGALTWNTRPDTTQPLRKAQ